MNIAIIFAGGVGSRMQKTGLPKQFLDLEGKPVLIRTIEKYSNNKSIDGIVVVCHPKYMEFLDGILKEYQIKKIKHVIPGGKTGQESIFNGLNCLVNEIDEEECIVLIHDGVRPFISDNIITESINIAREFGNCVVASKAIETIAISKNGEICEILNRENCLLLKAPQVFFFKDIYKAHVNARKENQLNFVDSAELMLCHNMKLKFLYCDSTNIKITTPIDFFAAQGIIKDEAMKHVYGI